MNDPGHRIQLPTVDAVTTKIKNCEETGMERERIIRLIEDEQAFLTAEDKRLLIERIRE